MAPRTENARKRKEEPEAVVSSGSDDDQSKRKARRVSTNASASNAASLQVDTPVTNTITANTACAANEEVDTPVATEKANTSNTASATTEDDESIQSIGKLIQDLFHSDKAKVNATLDALYRNLEKDKKKCDKIQAVGGCLALVQIMKKCLDKAIDEISACDQVTELSVLAELTTLHKSLNAITNLIFQHDESKIGITAIGGVEAVVKIMKTFPKCQGLQLAACCALRNLAYCSISKTKAFDSGGIEVFLAAANNQLDSSIVCDTACKGLINIVHDSKENTGQLINLGGAATFDKVRTKWPNDGNIQTKVRILATLIAVEMKAW